MNKLFRIRTEKDSVNRFKHDGCIIDINNFSQRIPVAAFFRSGQAVVSVSYCKNNRSRLAVSVSCFRNKLLESAINTVCSRARYLPANKSAASAIELKVIQQLTRFNIIENTVFRVVHENHDMRHLQRSPASDFDTGWQTLFNSSFRGTDWRNGIPAVIIVIEIHHAYKPPPYHAGRKRSFHIDITVMYFCKNTAFKIVPHDTVDGFSFLSDIF